MIGLLVLCVWYCYSEDGGVGDSGVSSDAGVLTRQGTFSKDNEREGSEGDTVSQAR